MNPTHFAALEAFMNTPELLVAFLQTFIEARNAIAKASKS
jgi:hypothetical protein